MTRRLDWAEYRTTEYDAIDPDRTIAILPTAAIEQHGPHLPVPAAAAARLRAALPDCWIVR